MSDDVAVTIGGCREATGRLLTALEVIDDQVCARPSLLPGWSVGHVLTHLARNADSFVRILRGAAEGTEARQYEGGDAERSRGVEEGAGRGAAAIVDDLRSSSARLDAAWDEAPPVVWERNGLRNDGSPFPCRTLPVSRWREVEVHHVDLGLGYKISDWPEEFVTSDLPHALDRLPRMIADASQRLALLAWVYGRADRPAEIDLRSF